LSWHEIFLFMLLGLGPSWVLVGCIYQEIPAFERALPEEFCIAAYISLVISFSVAFIVMNLIYIHFFGPAPHHISVPFTMGLEILAFILIASTWYVTVDGSSYMLFLAAFLGGGVGSLQMVLVMPWLSRFKPACITAFRVGTDTGSLLAGAVALVQKPGTNGSRFGPATYFSAFGALMILPVAAYAVIVRGDYGMRDKVDEELVVDNAGAEARPVETIEWGAGAHMEMTGNPLAPAIKNANSIAAASQQGAKKEPESVPAEVRRDTSSFMGLLLAVDDALEAAEQSFLTRVYRSVCRCCPSLSAEKVPWLPIVLPYMMTITWVDFNIFGFVYGVFPLAMKNATLVFKEQGLGDAYSQQAFTGYALQLATIAYVIGDSITFIYLFKIRYVLVIFTTCCSIIYIFGTSAFDGSVDARNLVTSEAVAPLLVFLYCVVNFCAPYLLCVCFREACSKPAVSDRESSARTLGLFDQASTVVGNVTLILLLGKSSSCH